MSPELDAFERMLDGKRLPYRWMLKAGLEALMSPGKAVIIYTPGVGGYALRRFYYSHRLRHLGKNSLIDVGAIMSGEKNISIGDYVWVDRYCGLEAVKGFIEIGRRVHVAPHSILVGFGGLTIGDYVGISADCKVYTTTEHYGDGMRMSGPMVPMRQKSVKVAPVAIERDAFLGTGSVVLPGVKIGEGAVVGANSVVTRDIPPWAIVVGAPAKPVGTRPKVTVPDV
jgi:galactoside O-acetyltransferase